MNDDGDLKDDVRMPDGEVGEKINRLFKTEEKDTSKPPPPSVRCAAVSMKGGADFFSPRRCHSHLHG